MDTQFKLTYSGIEYNVTVNGHTGETTIDPPDHPPEVDTMATNKSVQVLLAKLITITINSQQNQSTPGTSLGPPSPIPVQQSQATAQTASSTVLPQVNNETNQFLLARARPPIYTGNEDVVKAEPWLGSLKKYLIANNAIYNWYACSTIIPTLVGGKASTWTNNIVDECTSFEQFEARFTEEWINFSSRAGKLPQLLSCKMRPDE